MPALQNQRQAMKLFLINAHFGGMAGLPGTGPRGACCEQCVHLGFVTGDSRWGRCREYTRLNDQIGPAVPYDASACEFFVRNTSTTSTLNFKRTV
jgi:hypothetical protein